MANEQLDPSGGVDPFSGTSTNTGGKTIHIPDTSGVSTDSPFYAKPGKYVGKVVQVKDEPSKKGDPMLTFIFEITIPGKPKLKLSQWLVTTPGGMFRVKQTIEALGLSAGSIDIDKVVGRKALVELKDGMYNGEKTSSIKRVHKLPPELDPDDDVSF